MAYDAELARVRVHREIDLLGTNKIAGVAMTATAAELNLNDGQTATAVEVNRLDGIADDEGTAGTGITITEKGTAGLKVTLATLTTVSVTITNGTNAGYGSAKLYDFPDGAIAILGALVNLGLTVNGSNLGATADGDVHLGTTAQTDVAVGSIVSTEHDICPTAAIAQLVDGGGDALNQGGNVAGTKDGTTTAKDCYLNFLFDTADISDDDSVTLEGTVLLVWVSLGDY